MLIGVCAVGVMLVTSINSCTISKSLSGRNVSFLYQPTNDGINIENAVFNNDGTSNVKFKIEMNDLLITKDDNSNNYYSYSIRYRLFSTYSSPQPIDSGTIIRKDKLYFGEESIFDSLSLSTEAGKNYVIECVFRDFNSSKVSRFYVDLFRSQPFSHQTVILQDHSGERVYEKYIVEADSYDIYLAEPVDMLVVRYYKREFPTASPPFSTINPKPFDFTPTSIAQARKLSPMHFRVVFDKKGFYQVCRDENERFGASYFYFGDFYPEAKTLLDLAEPLRYISTNEEFERVLDGDQLKKSVDAYWLRIGDNPQRAKKLIMSFYSRVQFANQYFHSYLEGWKSDRGMCYIVFGPPDVVYRSTSSETWLYGEEGQFNSLSLTFTKVVNPFSYNDFRLNRSTSLKNPWYRAVEFWRQGRVLTYQ